MVWKGHKNGRVEEGGKVFRADSFRSRAGECTTDEYEGYESESTNVPNPDDWRSEMEDYAKMIHGQIMD